MGYIPNTHVNNSKKKKKNLLVAKSNKADNVFIFKNATQSRFEKH